VVPFPAWGWDFFSSPPRPHPVSTRGYFPEVERPGREADHSYPSEVTDVWRCTSTPPLRLHGVVLS